MLTDKQIKSAKPKEKAYKLADYKGLYLYVSSTGFKSWRYDYSYNGKRKTFTIGEYPNISLADARQAHMELRTKLTKGIDPREEEKAQKQAEFAKGNNTFEKVALEFFAIKNCEESTKARELGILKKYIFPFLASCPIDEISSRDVFEVLKRIEERELLNTLKKAKISLSQVFRYGVATSRCEYDVTSGLKGVFKRPQKQHFASLIDNDESEKYIGQFLQDIEQIMIDNKRVSILIVLAIKLILYTGVRSQEACKAEWKEFDFVNNIWTIPEEHKKERKEFRIPLSKQALAILKELHFYTGHKNLLFPSERGKKGHIAGESLSKFIGKILGYKDKQTIHGLRALLSTVANEKLGYNRDIVDKALAHKVGNEVSATYNRAEYLEQRQELMQDWADYLDELRTK